mgnify:CR=1 FL=1
MPYVLGVDIGATWLRVALADEKGRIIDRAKERTPKKGEPELISKIIINVVEQLMKKNNVEKIEAIGVGSIGPMDLNKGILTKPANIDIENIPIVDPLSERFKAPTYLVNDCTAGVVGEKVFGLGKETDNLVYITLSSGIGGGAIVDGNLLFGKDGNAVEIGHTVVDMEGKLKCGCGAYGHWEAYASGVNIPRFAKLLIEEKFGIESFKKSVLYKKTKGDINAITSEMVYTSAKEGDELALKITREIGRINAIGFANATNVYDPELITVGGSIALKNVELVIKPIQENIEKYLVNRKPRIEITPLGDDIVLYGAIALALHPEFIPDRFKKF